MMSRLFCNLGNASGCCKNLQHPPPSTCSKDLLEGLLLHLMLLEDAMASLRRFSIIWRPISSALKRKVFFVK